MSKGSSGSKALLYRRVNTRTRNVHHGGTDFRHERTRSKASDEPRGSMHGGARHGLDYTPLFRFLLSKVGDDWDAVYGEAIARLDRPDPIFWLVARTEAEKKPVVRVGESTYFSGLYVDEANRLQRVAPEVTVETLTPTCACCTHTFNGTPYVRRFGVD